MISKIKLFIINKFVFKSIKRLFITIGLLLYSISLAYGYSDSNNFENSKIISLDDIIKELPRKNTLSLEDIKTYKKIISYQKNNQWKNADKLITNLNNKFILGYIYYYRYALSISYKPSYKELNDWMHKYADLPVAKTIYILAKKKYRKKYKRKYKKLKKPLYPLIHSSIRKGKEEINLDKNRRKFYRTNFSRKEKKVLSYIKKHSSRGNFKICNNHLIKNRFKIREDAYLTALGYIVRGYYLKGYNNQAIQKTYEANKITKKKNSSSMDLNWWAGLAAYKQEKYRLSAYFFQTAHKVSYRYDWMHTATAYWTGRSYAKFEKSKARKYFIKARQRPNTFYGILAREKTNYLVPNPILKKFNFINSSFNKNKLFKSIHFYRATALAKIGEHLQADKELMYLYKYISKKHLVQLLIVSKTLKTPSTQVKVSKRIKYLQKIGFGFNDKEAKNFKNETYSFPELSNFNNYNSRIQKSFVHAIIRQESEFINQAKSSASARGLMQIIPPTATFIARQVKYKIRKFKRSNLHLLYNDKLNIYLGQSYMQYLLRKYKNNLIFSISAYNAGPGNVAKWTKRNKSTLNDPLLFMESIPVMETRGYVEKVLTNYWIYSQMFKENNKTLSDILRKRWPKYRH